MIFEKKYKFRYRCMTPTGILIRFSYNDIQNYFPSETNDVFQREYKKKIFLLDQMSVCQQSMSDAIQRNDGTPSKITDLEDQIKKRLSLKRQILKISNDMTNLRINQSSPKRPNTCLNQQQISKNTCFSFIANNENKIDNALSSSYEITRAQSTEITRKRNTEYFRIFSNQITYANNFLNLQKSGLAQNQINFLVNDKLDLSSLNRDRIIAFKSKTKTLQQIYEKSLQLRKKQTFRSQNISGRKQIRPDNLIISQQPYIHQIRPKSVEQCISEKNESVKAPSEEICKLMNRINIMTGRDTNKL